jgi:DNA processing protein
MSEPPPVLFVRGSIEALARPLVAVVGARDCSERGLEKASEATSLLVSRGFGVASGGARGIDGKSHEIALSLGGCTVAVLGTGVDIVYPAAHKELFGQIEKNGALVSELLPGTPPAPKFFPTRNRIIAGLSLAVILIEGRRISGSLSTARWAIKLGRPVASPVQESNEGLGEATAILRELGGCVYADGNELQEFLRPIRDGVFAGPA